MEQYIISDPKIMMGKPVVAGTRITEELILAKFSAGKSIKQIIKSYPKLNKKVITAVMQWELRNILSETKKVLEQMYGKELINVILYGSYARGDYDENSDIDILVVLKNLKSTGEEIDRIVDAIYDINLKHNTLISVVPISYEDYKNINSPLLLNVRKEGIIVE